MRYIVSRVSNENCKPCDDAIIKQIRIGEEKRRLLVWVVEFETFIELNSFINKYGKVIIQHLEEKDHYIYDVDGNYVNISGLDYYHLIIYDMYIE